jgi:hypothetical protein
VLWGRGGNRERQPDVPTLGPVVRGKFMICLEVDVSLHIAERKSVANLRAGGEHARFVVAERCADSTGPGGGVVSGARTDNRWAFSDLYPQVQLKWNNGVHNYMVYTQWGIPTGTYDPNRLSNLGVNHWSADFGLGYTYFNPHSGWEYTIVGGMTYNFENPATNYQNGVDGHIDWATLAKYNISAGFYIRVQINDT